MKTINPNERVTLLGSTFGSTHPDFKEKFTLQEAVRIIVEEWPLIMQHTACVLREGRPIYTSREIIHVYDSLFQSSET